MSTDFRILVAIAAGGAAGALARHLVTGWVHARTGLAFPWGTMAVNLAGCFLIGLLFGAMEGAELAPSVRPLVAVGFLGAFTTFSTFGYETLLLVEGGHAARALWYVGGSVASGLVLVAGGLGLGRALAG